MEKIGIEAVFDINQFTRNFNAYNRMLGTANTNTSTFVNSMQTIGRTALGIGAAGLAAAGTAVAAFTYNAVEDAISVESAWAGVTKTTDGLVDASGNLTTAGEEIIRLSVL